MTEIDFSVQSFAVFAIEFCHTAFFVARSVEAVLFGQGTNNLVILEFRSIKI